MRKGKLLNSNINRVLGNMGAQDCITLSNIEMSIPECNEKIDLALQKGTPSLMETLEVVLSEYNEGIVVLPEEIKEDDPKLLEAVLSKVSEDQVQYVSYMQFRKRSERSKAVVRTGEISRYGCILLESKGLK